MRNPCLRTKAKGERSTDRDRGIEKSTRLYCDL